MLVISKSVAPPLLMVLDNIDIRSPTASDDWGFTCFTYAIKQNFVVGLLLMLAKGLKLEKHVMDSNDCCYTQWAAFADRQFILGLLITQGHDFLKKDKLKQTPWDHAVENWSLRCIKMMLDYTHRPIKTNYFLRGSTDFQVLRLVPDTPRTPADRIDSRYIPGRLKHLERLRNGVYDSVWQTITQWPNPLASIRDCFYHTWYRDNIKQQFWWRVCLFVVVSLLSHLAVLVFTSGDISAFSATYLLAVALIAMGNLLLAFKFGTVRVNRQPEPDSRRPAEVPTLESERC